MRLDDKKRVTEELHQALQENDAVYLTDFTGLNVKAITEFRSQLREQGLGYRVVKNTLALRAAEGTSVEAIKEYFEGPTAIAYSDEGVVDLAKILRGFIKEHSGVSFKVGVMDGHVLSGDQVADLADMPSREELLSKVMFLMTAPLTQLAMGLKSPIQKLALLLKQLEENKQQA